MAKEKTTLIQIDPPPPKKKNCPQQIQTDDIATGDVENTNSTD